MKLAVLLLFLICLFTSACKHEKEFIPPNNTDLTMNKLTEAEKLTGWKLLFDGQTTAGWRNFNQPYIKGWQASNGALTTPGKQGDIISEEQFANFELTLEYLLSAQGNSGIFFYVQDSPQYSAIWHTGPEFQIIDDHHYPVPLTAKQQTGANYDMQAPTKLAARKPGEWNQVRMLVNNGHVEHWLNGEKVVEYTFDSPAWQEQLATSKFATHDYAKVRRGHLALQDHGDPVAFRNIKIREL
ncbi:3-keto-disaccharide hydrolase [Adhaeribacter rhizoryzae]|uniref:DUF1080 domain-containing protein n=1 Tax=Adhaeribacter rhizoryzae TaxID=2607907 RepID=A0A5M6D274_9BACT|nr:DUF1080 domain-containing protein [Adhaeribacter rhizoryzae]KAA5539235.1 DUF1080 domain-containing protein [Adhaeribacter rhizoryzae]